MIDIGENVFELRGRELCEAFLTRQLGHMQAFHAKAMRELATIEEHEPPYEIYVPIAYSIAKTAGAADAMAAVRHSRGRRNIWSIWDYPQLLSPKPAWVSDLTKKPRATST